MQNCQERQQTEIYIRNDVIKMIQARQTQRISAKTQCDLVFERITKEVANSKNPRQVQPRQVRGQGPFGRGRGRGVQVDAWRPNSDVSDMKSTVVRQQKVFTETQNTVGINSSNNCLVQIFDNITIMQEQNPSLSKMSIYNATQALVYQLKTGKTLKTKQMLENEKKVFDMLNENLNKLPIEKEHSIKEIFCDILQKILLKFEP